MLLENIKIYKSTGSGRGAQYFVRLGSLESAILLLNNPKRIWITSQLKTQYSMEETSWPDFLVVTGFSKEDVIREIKRAKSESCLR